MTPPLYQSLTSLDHASHSGVRPYAVRELQAAFNSAAETMTRLVHSSSPRLECLKQFWASLDVLTAAVPHTGHVYGCSTMTTVAPIFH